MRFIPTTSDQVEALKKQAKRLQRNGGGKHAVLLDRVARSAGYEHWHHVTLCLRESTEVHESRHLLPEIEGVVRAALNGVGKVVVTGPEASTSQPFVLVSTSDGDAWMLDPEDDRLLCLVWQKARQNFTVRDLPTRIEIEWSGTFQLSGPFFSVETQIPGIGSRYIGGYPVERIREALDDVRSADKRMEQIFDRPDAVALSPEIIAQLVRGGWEESTLLDAARRGAQYSPSRNTVLFPPVSSF